MVSATASALLLGGAPGVSAADPHPAPARGAAGAAADPAPQSILQLIPLQLPLLSVLGGGLPAVGDPLAVTAPVWNLLGVSNSVVWLRDGVPIPGTAGLWSYVPTDLDAGHQVAARVTGTLLGLVPLSLVTEALGIPLPGGTGPGDPVAEAPEATSPVTVTGVGKVGSVLTAVAPTWDQTGVATTYQWLRNGTPIPQAAAPSYVVKAADVGTALAVRATGTKGDLTGTSTSTTVLGLLGDVISALTKPGISGTPAIGRVLTASPGTWSGLGIPLFTYQWYRGTTEIPGATASGYQVQDADAGQVLAVVVRATTAGFGPGLSYAVTRVAKRSSTTQLVLSTRKAPQGTRVPLRIVLSGGQPAPSGLVKVMDGSRALRSYRVRPADNGQLLVELPKLKPGPHRLVATFAGDAVREASTSAPVVLTIVKKKRKPRR
ncbi:Ig-like domain repeat protein [Nocardioides nanhaiensis]|uniref:Bacterial Ig-like domain-containing protein n=1 Tax=Nocardioides nanhaiensis TaxID=1476871 RepID=A0ABP8VTU4_9ACTN